MKVTNRRLPLLFSVAALTSIGLSAVGTASEAAGQKRRAQAADKRTAAIQGYKPVDPDTLKRQLLGSSFGARLSPKASLVMAIYGDAHSYYGETKYDEILQLLDIGEKVFRDMQNDGTLWHPERFTSAEDVQGYQLLFAESFRLRAKSLLKLGREDEALAYWDTAAGIKPPSSEGDVRP